MLVEAKPIEPVSLTPGTTKQAYVFEARRGGAPIELLDDLAFYDLEVYFGAEESLLKGLRLARRVEELKLASGVRLGRFERVEAALQIISAGTLFLKLGGVLRAEDEEALAAVPRPEGSGVLGNVMALMSLIVRRDINWSGCCLRRTTARFEAEAEVLRDAKERDVDAEPSDLLEALTKQEPTLAEFFDGVSVELLQAKLDLPGLYKALVGSTVIDKKAKIGLSTNDCFKRAKSQGDEVDVVVIAKFLRSFYGCDAGGKTDRDGMRTYIVEMTEAICTLQEGGLGPGSSMFGSPFTMLAGNCRFTSAATRKRRREQLDMLLREFGLRMGAMPAALRSRAEVVVQMLAAAAAALDDVEQQEEELQSTQPVEDCEMALETPVVEDAEVVELRAAHERAQAAVEDVREDVRRLKRIKALARRHPLLHHLATGLTAAYGSRLLPNGPGLRGDVAIAAVEAAAAAVEHKAAQREALAEEAESVLVLSFDEAEANAEAALAPLRDALATAAEKALQAVRTAVEGDKLKGSLLQLGNDLDIAIAGSMPTTLMNRAKGAIAGVKHASAAVEQAEARQLDAAKAADATTEADGVGVVIGVAAQQAEEAEAAAALVSRRAELTKAEAELQAVRAALGAVKEEQSEKSRRGYRLQHGIPNPTSGRMRAEEAVAAAGAAGLELALSHRHGETQEEAATRYACVRQVKESYYFSAKINGEHCCSGGGFATEEECAFYAARFHAERQRLGIGRRIIVTYDEEDGSTEAHPGKVIDYSDEKGRLVRFDTSSKEDDCWVEVDGADEWQWEAARPAGTKRKGKGKAPAEKRRKVAAPEGRAARRSSRRLCSATSDTGAVTSSSTASAGAGPSTSAEPLEREEEPLEQEDEMLDEPMVAGHDEPANDAPADEPACPAAAGAPVVPVETVGQAVSADDVAADAASAEPPAPAALQPSTSNTAEAEAAEADPEAKASDDQAAAAVAEPVAPEPALPPTDLGLDRVRPGWRLELQLDARDAVAQHAFMLSLVLEDAAIPSGVEMAPPRLDWLCPPRQRAHEIEKLLTDTMAPLAERLPCEVDDEFPRLLHREPMPLDLQLEEPLLPSTSPDIDPILGAILNGDIGAGSGIGSNPWGAIGCGVAGDGAAMLGGNAVLDVVAMLGVPSSQLLDLERKSAPRPETMPEPPRPPTPPLPCQLLECYAARDVDAEQRDAAWRLHLQFQTERKLRRGLHGWEDETCSYDAEPPNLLRTRAFGCLLPRPPPPLPPPPPPPPPPRQPAPPEPPSPPSPSAPSPPRGDKRKAVAAAYETNKQQRLAPVPQRLAEAEWLLWERETKGGIMTRLEALEQAVGSVTKAGDTPAVRLTRVLELIRQIM